MRKSPFVGVIFRSTRSAEKLFRKTTEKFTALLKKFFKQSSKNLRKNNYKRFSKRRSSIIKKGKGQ